MSTDRTVPAAEQLQAIEQRVRPTICQTFSSRGGATVEGRISEDDFDTLLTLARRPADAGGAAIEASLAALVAAYYRREIGRLMQQAEHWAANAYPLAVHHRLHKADAYFQIVSLCERAARFADNAFDVMRRELARDPIKPLGTYPPSAELYRYRDAAFVAALPPLPKSPPPPADRDNTRGST